MLAYKSFYEQTPIHLISLFVKSNYNYNLRRKLTLVLPKARTDYMKKSIPYSPGDNAHRCITCTVTKGGINSIVVFLLVKYSVWLKSLQ